VALFG